MLSLPVLVTSALLAAWLGTAWWQVRKPLPRGLHITGPWQAAHDPALLLDETWLDASGRRQCRQQIFDEWFRLIGQARRRVVIDVFQLNALADERTCHRAIAGELCRALLQRKAEVPALDVLLITDPINSCYGNRLPPHLAALRQAGIQVVITDLRPGRDPNPVWSAPWRLVFQWLGNPAHGGWLPNPLGSGRVTLRCYLSLLNLNANHRKVLVTDQGDDWLAVVGSANADDGSSAYRDTALRLRGAAALDLLESELAIACFSGGSPPPSPRRLPAPPSCRLPRLRILTEGAIRDALLGLIDQARNDECLDISVLYLAHRRLVRALRQARERGVMVRLLLDPNDSHFGHRSPGLPNRPVARELHAAGLAIRWSAVPGIHAHSKVLLRHGGPRPAELLVGSANFTRRSLDDYNFEAAVHLVAEHDHPLIRRARESFARYWHNLDGETHSRPFTAFDDATRWRYWRYRLMEASGWCLF